MKAIDAIEGEERGERTYIGASMAATECVALLSLTLRGFPSDPVPARQRRIFRDGHRIEKQVISDLKRAGFSVMEEDELSGRQHHRAWLGGHVAGSADGLIELNGELMLLEIKSMKGSLFSRFTTKGVRVSHPHYCGQMMMLMALFRIPACLFVAYCKDTSEYHAEIVRFDQDLWDRMYVHIQAAISGRMDRVSSRPEDWRCRSCAKRSACWADDLILEPECRQCRHSCPNDEGTWTCRITNQEATQTCDQYEMARPQPKG